MCAITRASRMVPRSCCRTSSGKTRTLVAWCMALQAFRSARRSCSKSFSRWRLERGPGAFDFLSDGPGRGTLDLLQGDRPRGGAGTPPAARASLFLANVRASPRQALRSLSPDRTGLPGLRTQRLAAAERLRVYLRSLRRDHEPLHRSARAFALHALHAGLRRSRGISHGARESGPDRGVDRPGRRGAQRRPGGELEAAPRLLGRSRGERGDASRKSPVARGDAHPSCRKRPRRGTLRPGSLDRRVRLSQPARASRHPKRSLLRLPHERRQLSEVASVDAREATSAARPLGKARPVLRAFGTRSLSPRRAERRSPHSRRGSLRARYGCRPHFPARRRFHEPESPASQHLEGSLTWKAIARP